MIWGNGSSVDASGQSDRAASASPQSNDVVPVKKLDHEQQLVYGEVFAPGFPDSQGDWMTEASIQKMAHEFLRNGRVSKIDVQHSQQESGCYVVESFIARKGDPDFIPGSWVLGVKIPDPGIWSLVKSGELNGFSLDGFGIRVDTVLELDIPDILEGETDFSSGHKHTFFAKFDAEGRFLGGQTGPGPDGHTHTISRGTVTEEARGHSHRFSFVEGIIGVQAQRQSN